MRGRKTAIREVATIRDGRSLLHPYHVLSPDGFSSNERMCGGVTKNKRNEKTKQQGWKAGLPCFGPDERTVQRRKETTCRQGWIDVVSHHKKGSSVGDWGLV